MYLLILNKLPGQRRYMIPATTLNVGFIPSDCVLDISIIRI